MSVVAESDRPPASLAPDAAAPLKSSPPPTLRRNFWLLVIYQVVLRVGWIFKTESIVMPAVLDMVGAGAWLRAWLPTLNRFGQTVPPLLFAERLRCQPLKKTTLALTAALMGLCFGVLAVCWRGWAREGVPAWYGVVFLATYTAFFVAVGLNQLSFGTLQGKLIPAERRGRLLVMANLIGVAVAVTATALLLPRWLRAETGEFQWIFGFTALCFGVSALTMLGVRERPEGAGTSSQPATRRLALAVSYLKQDQKLRRISIVASSLGASIMLFPHYQAVAREQAGLGFETLVVWLIVQNLGTALFSVPAGSLADRIGNRFVLRIYLSLILLAPILCLFLARWGTAAAPFYTAVFFFIGLTPVTIKLLTNYTLELTSTDRHPFYLSVLGLSLGVPTMLLSPAFGLLIDAWGFEVGFGLILGWITVGWVTTWTIAEPRWDQLVSGDEPPAGDQMT